MHTFVNGAVSAYTATTASGVALDVTAGRIRKYACFSNTGSVDVSLGLGVAAVSGSGVYLKASGGSFELNANNMFLGTVYAISASSTANVSIQEGY